MPPHWSLPSHLYAHAASDALSVYRYDATRDPPYPGKDEPCVCAPFLVPYLCVTRRPVEALGTGFVASGDGEGWITVGVQAMAVNARKPRSDALDPALRDQMQVGRRCADWWPAAP